MADEQGPVPGGTPPQPSGREQELAAELEKVRGRSNALKIVAIVASVLLLALAAGGYYVYRRIMAVKNALEYVSQSYQPGTPGKDGIPEPVRAVGPNDGSAAQVQSSLSMFSLPSSEEGAGQAPAGPGGTPPVMNKETAQQMLQAMNKYASHPLVKEFLEDLKQTGDYRAATGGRKDVNPIEVMAKMQGSSDMRGLIMKYMRRPEFPGLMQEILRDPAMAPLMSRMPGPAYPAPTLPQSPQVTGISAEPKAAKPKAANESEDSDNDGELTFDASAVSGGGEPKYKRGAPPPPVDSGR